MTAVKEAKEVTTFQAFGNAIAAALATKGITQAELGQRVGIVQSAVSAWVAGTAEPPRDTVWAIERVLGLTPGFLSRQLPSPYQPVTKNAAVATVEEAVIADPLLDESGKRAVLAVYRELVSYAPRRTGRPRGSTARR